VIALAGSVCAPSSARAAPADRPSLSLSGDPHAGFVTIEWSAPEPGNAETAAAVEFELQEARDETFSEARVRYRGTHKSSVLSGLRDGAYFYRVRFRTGGDWSVWSQTRSFEVSHHSIGLAAALFGLGGFVFFATLLFLLRMRT
jgi:phosphodiesterase/alkaline phosphatase D-like protein